MSEKPGSQMAPPHNGQGHPRVKGRRYRSQTAATAARDWTAWPALRGRPLIR